MYTQRGLSDGDQGHSDKQSRKTADSPSQWPSEHVDIGVSLVGEKLLNRSATVEISRKLSIWCRFHKILAQFGKLLI